jgi:hypothetical protein
MCATLPDVIDERVGRWPVWAQIVFAVLAVALPLLVVFVLAPRFLGDLLGDVGDFLGDLIYDAAFAVPAAIGAPFLTASPALPDPASFATP